MHIYHEVGTTDVLPFACGWVGYIQVDLMRRLHHPNIVGYRDSFLTPRKDHLCIVMEYCDGGDLSSQIKNAR